MAEEKEIHDLERTILTHFQSGNEKGMVLLYKHYNQSLFGIVSSIITDEHLAEDVLQEVFVKIWGNRDKYSPDKGRLYTWMVNIARNSAIDKLRSKNFKQHQKTKSEEDFVIGFENQSFTPINPDTIGLQDVVSKLKDDHKDVIELVYFQGYTQQEAAEKLDIPLGTIKTRLRSAIQKLREIVN